MNTQPQCEFQVAFKQCPEFATHRRHVVVKTKLKGQPHQWSPPDSFYCDRHSVMVAKWVGGPSTTLPYASGEMFPL